MSIDCHYSQVPGSRNRDGESASTLLELLCSILLLSIIAAGAINSVRSGLLLCRAEIEDARLLNKAQTIFRRVGRASTSELQEIVQSVFVAKADTMRDALGRKHPLTLRTDSLRPAKSSDLISGIRPTLALTLRRIGDDPEPYRYCIHQHPAGERGAAGQAKSWLALSPDGQVHVRVQIRVSRRSRDCPNGKEFVATLTPIETSVFTSSPATTRQEVNRLVENHFILLAVEEAYTLYVDSQKTLRRHSEHTRDNQPLIAGVTLLRIREKPDPYGKAEFSVDISLRHSRKGEKIYTRTFPGYKSEERSALLLLDGGTSK